MKKQLFSLVMMLAIVVLAGTSAMAQNSTNEAANTSTATYVMLTGSTHTFTVAKGRASSTLAWAVFDGANGATASDASDYAATTGTDQLSFGLTWAETASGLYTIQVTETNDNATGNCSTVRRFYVNVLDFDVLVYASDAAGNLLSTTDELADCGSGSTANYGNEGPGAAFNNQFGGSTNAGKLDGYTGQADDAVGGHTALTTRNFSIAVRWDDNINLNDIPEIGSLKFNYTANVNHDLYQVNTTTPSATSGVCTGTTFVVAADVTNPAADTRPAGLTNDARTVIYTIPVTFRDRWFSSSVDDITADLAAAAASVYSGTDGATGLLGVEPTYNLSDPGLTNQSATQTIQLAPATSTISVAP